MAKEIRYRNIARAAQQSTFGALGINPGTLCQLGAMLVVGVPVHALIRGTGEAWDEAVVWVTTIAVPIVLVFVAVFLSRLVVSTPLSLIRGRDTRIRGLEEQLKQESPLTIVFDKDKHRIDQGSLLFCIGLCNHGKQAIDRISVVLEDIEPLSNKQRLRHHVRKLIGLPLMLKEEITHQDTLPTKEFILYGESERDIAVVCGEAGGGALHVYHADYRFGMAVLSSGAKATEPRIPASLPAGRYRMVIRAKGADGSSDKQSFVVSLTKRTFTFQPDYQ